MPRKKKVEKTEQTHSLSFLINGVEETYTGSSFKEILDKLTDRASKSVVFKTKLVVTIGRDNKRAIQMMNRNIFRRLCANKATKELYARHFDLLTR